MKDISDEQRNYFRITDTVFPEYQAVAQSDIQQNSPDAFFSTSEKFWLLRELRTIDRENSQILRHIAEQEKDISIYLKAINRKIDLLSQAIIRQDDDNNSASPQKVTLSEGGLSFISEKQINAKQYLAIKLTLLPTHIGLTLFARVIDSLAVNDTEHKPGGSFRTSVAFVALNENDRHILARHIMQVQSTVQRLRLHGE